MSNDQTRGSADPSPPQPDRARTFKFNFSFGRKPPVDDPDYQRLLERAMKDTESSPDGTGTAEDVREVLTIDSSDGKLVSGKAVTRRVKSVRPLPKKGARRSCGNG